MILPTKHIDESHSFLGLGAVILENLETPRTVTSLWDQLREKRGVGTYWRFVLGLDLVYAMGAIDLADGLIFRCKK